ncbi:hypothetical protein DFP72DRAFT_1078390 [Ephemerocybe angulata]|uniref:Ubiquitin-like domain-containing protein n=1 Tax=Ephemerocybe angulata TaxID=980116 RepID=A0A8H6HEY6_9AGAR|nr:hypothetical protein DFP72DRAFT_1078390 [Tulosesus angulatus]
MSEKPASRLPHVSHMHSLMEPSRTLTMYPAPPSQLFQQFFAGASNFSVGGGQFNAIGGDYVVSSIDPDQLERLLAQLRQAELAYRSISQHVGYSSANGVTIIDALDERVVLPPSIVAEFGEVHDFLVKHFRGVLGEELVAEKKYRIARQHDGQLVKPEDWKEVLEVGEVVVMSMLIGRVWVKSVRDTCPNAAEWLKCRRCKMRYLCSMRPDRRSRPPRSPKEIGSFRHVVKEHVNYVGHSLEAHIQLADRFRLVLSGFSYAYVVLPLEAHIPLADRFVLLFSRVPYVGLPLEPYIPLADRSVPLPSSSRYNFVSLNCPPDQLTSLCSRPIHAL